MLPDSKVRKLETPSGSETGSDEHERKPVETSASVAESCVDLNSDPGPGIRTVSPGGTCMNK